MYETQERGFDSRHLHEYSSHTIFCVTKQYQKCDIPAVWAHIICTLLPAYHAGSKPISNTLRDSHNVTLSERITVVIIARKSPSFSTLGFEQ